MTPPRTRATRLAQAVHVRLFAVFSVASLKSVAPAKGMCRSLLISNQQTQLLTWCRYIKELADRINSIESKLESEGGLSQDEIDKLFGSDRHRGPNGTGSEEPNRKRPFSSISTGDFSTPMSNRQVPWGSEPRSIQPASGQSDNYADFNNSSLAPQPSEIKPDETPSKTVGATDMTMLEDTEVVEIHEDVLNE